MLLNLQGGFSLNKIVICKGNYELVTNLNIISL